MLTSCSEEDSGLSSISGSEDSSDEDEQHQQPAQRSPLIAFENSEGEQYTIWRGVLSSERVDHQVLLKSQLDTRVVN